MAEESFRLPPDAAGMAEAERAIRRAGLVALAAFLASCAAAVAILPGLVPFPESVAARLAFAAQAGVLVLAWVVVGVGMVSTARRFSPEDIGGAAAGPPSQALAIKVAFLQNTLEQAVIAAGLFAALAVLMPRDGLAAIPVAVVFFAVGRVLFLRGYARGVRGRALGMTLTMMPAVVGYPVAIALIAWRLVAG